MRPVLASRLSLLALVAVFAIPVATSSLTHVVTCEEPVKTPFTFIIPEGGGEATLVSWVSITRGQNLKQEVCGGLSLNMRAATEGEGRVRVTLPITNSSRFTWRGTVQLILGSTTIPIGIGEIRSGQTASDSVVIRVDRGAHELNGSLLIGP